MVVETALVLTMSLGQVDLAQESQYPSDAVMDSILASAVVAPTTEEREAILRETREFTTQWAADEPEDPNALYWQAAVTGLLAETAGSREKIQLGVASKELAEAALALDPDHAGANHVLGRIHAGVKRLGWLTRVVGRRMGLGPLLDSATWDQALFYLGHAAELEPENVIYGLEYAIALKDVDSFVPAVSELTRITSLTPRTDADRAAQDRARALLEDMD